jgi:hypothetical protein
MSRFLALILFTSFVSFTTTVQRVQVSRSFATPTDMTTARPSLRTNTRFAKNPIVVGLDNSSEWDVVRSKSSAGADLFITPWGNITGIGPQWQTPDIFVVDDSDAPIPAARGRINRLRARVKNVGTLPANGVTIRFKYAPSILGTPDFIFKEIGAVSANFEPGQTKDIAVCWDLTDLTDTNGGIWPATVAAFDHFCVKVFIEFNGDPDLSNNIAQTNFVDVQLSPTGAPPTFNFLFGNPFKTEEEAELILSPPLPRGFAVQLRGSPVTFGKKFKLKPEEIRFATIAFTVPPDLAKYAPTSDVVANVSLRIRDELTGGVSVRLARKVPKVKRAY